MTYDNLHSPNSSNIAKNGIFKITIKGHINLILQVMHNGNISNVVSFDR